MSNSLKAIKEIIEDFKVACVEYGEQNNKLSQHRMEDIEHDLLLELSLLAEKLKQTT